MRQYGWADFSVDRHRRMLGHSLPGFFVGILLILIFSYWLGVLPSYGAYSTRNLMWAAPSSTGSGTWCCRWRC